MTIDWRVVNLLADRFFTGTRIPADLLRLYRTCRETRSAAGGLAAAVVTAPRTTRSCCGRLRPATPSPMSAQPSATRLRFPLAGQPLEALVSARRARDDRRRAARASDPGRRARPAAGRDRGRRRRARAAAAPDRLPDAARRRRLARRRASEQLETLVSPEFARRFHGHVEVHDVERDDLVELGTRARIPLRVHPALVETDVVVVVTAAETVLHGGPAALVGAAGTEVLRAAARTRCSRPAARRAGGLRSSSSARSRGACRSSAPRSSSTIRGFGGTLGGYPYEAAGARARRPLAVPPGLPRLLPGALRALRPALCAARAHGRRASSRVHPRSRIPKRCCAGSSCAASRSTVSWTPSASASHARLPTCRASGRTRCSARTSGSGWHYASGATRFPSRKAGPRSSFTASSATSRIPTQQPYRAFFAATRATGPTTAALAEAERAAPSPTRVRSRRTAPAGRAIRCCPSSDWDACRPALGRLGHVIIAGCRDHGAARQLGFVPTHGVGRGADDGPRLDRAPAAHRLPPRAALLPDSSQPSRG